LLSADHSYHRRRSIAYGYDLACNNNMDNKPRIEMQCVPIFLETCSRDLVLTNQFFGPRLSTINVLRLTLIVP
jgi:hypothetical protein